MSLTSYRAAPPRATIRSALALKQKRRLRDRLESGIFNTANGFFEAPVSKPGDDLLFHCFKIPYLEGGFPLRCFQRLSRPCIATLLRGWRHDRSTRGVFTPVLSY